MSTETTEQTPAGSPVVGAAIREARLNAELTQDELAALLGVTQTCVSHWENARRDPGVTDLLRVAATIGVPVVSLLGAEYFSAPEPEPEADPRPPGIWGRVELPGRRDHTGWITEETRFGAQVAVVRDWDGHEVAWVAIGPGCQVLPLPTPLKRPEPAKALPAGRFGYLAEDGYDEDDERPWGGSY